MEDKIGKLDANVNLLNEGNTQSHEVIQSLSNQVGSLTSTMSQLQADKDELVVKVDSLSTSLMQAHADQSDLAAKMRNLEQWMLKYEHNSKVMKDKIGNHEHDNLMMKHEIQILKDALEETKKRKREDDFDGEAGGGVVPEAPPNPAE